MFARTTYTYERVRATARYETTCSECGKTLKRTAEAEHTVNPFNKNEAGEPKSYAQVYVSAEAEAKRKAEKLSGKPIKCRDCSEKPMIDLLKQMGRDPDALVPIANGASSLSREEWPMSVLEDREYVERPYVECSCGAPCCSKGYWARAYRLTHKGKERAARLLAKETANA